MPKLFKKVVAFDANSLYLWAIMQPIPTGNYSRRLVDNCFERQGSGKMASEWLEWEAFQHGIHIRR